MSADAASDSPPKSLRLLLVENHADTLKYLRMYLTHLGHTVDAATTLAEAVAAAPQHDYDVLISDIGLPDGSGWELLQRAHFSQPVLAIAMSGYGTGADQKKSKAAGFDYHLTKPFDPAELEGFLQKAQAGKARGNLRPSAI